MEENITITEETNQQSNEALLAEVDRRVREAVAQARAQWQADAAQADAERARVENMTDEQRADYALTQRENALDERERRLVERELRAKAVEMLAQRGLPAELADALPYSGEVACMNGLDRVEQAFRKAVQKGVDERLRGQAPAAGSGSNANPDALSDRDYYQRLAR